MKDVSKKQLLELLGQRDARIEELQSENALLRQKVDLLIRKVFGASSEKLDPAQLDLFLLQAKNAPGKSQASSALEEGAAHGSKASPRSCCRPQDHLPDDLPVIVTASPPVSPKVVAQF